MAEFAPIDRPWRILFPEGLFSRLHRHLFPGDDDEHGAVVVAGIAVTDREVRLLARDVHLARDGVDYVPGKRGYRMLKADFISDCIGLCRDERLVYLAVHNHGGTDSVGFSGDDFRSHERGYPALLDIAKGMPVGALVFARNAVAGDIWLPGEDRIELASASIVGQSLRRLTPHPTKTTRHSGAMYDRQARLFGDGGQEILSEAKAGIIGAGGVASLLAEYLGRLGVGHFAIADPDRVSISNLPRLVAALRRDAMTWLVGDGMPQWLRVVGTRFSKAKVLMAKRNILRANPQAVVDAIFGDFLEPEICERFTDCDYLFLAADSMRARLLFNAIVHQYLIPGVQVGTKVQVDPEDGAVVDVFSVVRPVSSESGCLLCSKLINSAKLQEESISEADRKRQKYVDDPDVVAPSVITLNAEAAGHAATDFLFYMTGLRSRDAHSAYMRFEPRDRRVSFDSPQKSATCPECGQSSISRLARGDGRRLPTILRN